MGRFYWRIGVGETGPEVRRGVARHLAGVSFPELGSDEHQLQRHDLTHRIGVPVAPMSVQFLLARASAGIVPEFATLVEHGRIRARLGRSRQKLAEVGQVCPTSHHCRPLLRRCGPLVFQSVGQVWARFGQDRPEFVEIGLVEHLSDYLLATLAPFGDSSVRQG